MEKKERLSDWRYSEGNFSESASELFTRETKETGLEKVAEQENDSADNEAIDPDFHIFSNFLWWLIVDIQHFTEQNRKAAQKKKKTNK